MMSVAQVETSRIWLS